MTDEMLYYKLDESRYAVTGQLNKFGKYQQTLPECRQKAIINSVWDALNECRIKIQEQIDFITETTKEDI